MNKILELVEIFILIKFQGNNNLHMKEKINIVWKEEKKRQGSNRTTLIHSNASNFFKKQHTITLYYSANKRSLEK